MVKLLKIILIILACFLLSCIVKGQDPQKLNDDELKTLWEELRAPAAIDRARAAIKLQPYVTKKDVELLLHGKETRYKDGISKTPPDLMKLATLLSGGWPKVMDDYEDDLYDIQDEEYVPIFAGILFNNSKLSRIDEDLPICEPWLRDEFYADYFDRISYSFIWRDKYLYITNKPWLKERYLKEKHVSRDSKLIVQLLAGDDVPDEIISGSWLRFLKKAIETGEKPEVTGIRVYTIIGRIDAAELVSMLLDKPEWLEGYQDDLKNSTYRMYDPFEKKYKIETFDSRNAVVLAMIDCHNGHIEKAFSRLTPVLTNKGNAYRDIDKKVILHHPFFFDLRVSAGFKEWWKDNCQIDIVDADPEFLTIDWRTP